MDLALAEAHAAAHREEVPVGAVVLSANGVPMAGAGNEVEERNDPSAHAEMLAMRKAAQVTGSTRLDDCTLVVTLEPCPMCAAAAVHFRVRRIVFGAYDPKGGGIDHGPRVIDHPTCLRHIEVIGGVREKENSLLLKNFFRKLRR